MDPESAIVGFLTLAIARSIRAAIVLTFLPAPFSGVAPMPVRVLLSLGAGLVAAYANGGGGLAQVDLLELSVWAPLLAGEALAGAAIALTVRASFATIEAAGTTIAQAMGLGFAATVDPSFGEESYPTTRVMTLLAGVVFFEIGGHRALTAALIDPDAATGARALLSGGDLEAVTRPLSQLVAHGLRIAAPVFATMLVVQLVTAIAARSAPRMHVFETSFAVAVCAGLILLLLALSHIAQSVRAEIGALAGALPALWEAR